MRSVKWRRRRGGEKGALAGEMRWEIQIQKKAEVVELINVWIILIAVDCRVRPCLIGVDHLGWAAAKATAFNLCYCCCRRTTDRLLLSCCCHRCTTARPWRSMTSSISSGTSAWRGRSGRRSWETCSRLLCRWRSRMLLIMLELNFGFWFDLDFSPGPNRA